MRSSLPRNSSMPMSGGPGTAYTITKRESPCQDNAARYTSKLSTLPPASVAVPSPWSPRDRYPTISGESVSSPVNPVSITASIDTSRPVAHAQRHQRLAAIFGDAPVHHGLSGWVGREARATDPMDGFAPDALYVEPPVRVPSPGALEGRKLVIRDRIITRDDVYDEEPPEMLGLHLRAYVPLVESLAARDGLLRSVSPILHRAIYSTFSAHLRAARCSQGWRCLRAPSHTGSPHRVRRVARSSWCSSTLRPAHCQNPPCLDRTGRHRERPGGVLVEPLSRMAPPISHYCSPDRRSRGTGSARRA